MKKIKIFRSVSGDVATPELGIKETYKSTTPEFRELYKKAGVYLLWLEEGSKKPIYIGRAIKNIGKTVTRHFMKWDAKEMKYQERRPKQLDKLFVTYEEYSPAEELTPEQDIIIDRETELIEKYKPYLNIRKGADKHKDPKRYKESEESRILLEQAINKWEDEQAMRKEDEIIEAAEKADDIKNILLQEEAAASEAAAAEALQDLEQAQAEAPAAPPEEIKELKGEFKEAEKEAVNARRRLNSFKQSHKLTKKSNGIRKRK